MRPRSFDSIWIHLNVIRIRFLTLKNRLGYLSIVTYTYNGKCFELAASTTPFRLLIYSLWEISLRIIFNLIECVSSTEARPKCRDQLLIEFFFVIGRKYEKRQSRFSDTKVPFNIQPAVIANNAIHNASQHDKNQRDSPMRPDPDESDSSTTSSRASKHHRHKSDHNNLKYHDDDYEHRHKRSHKHRSRERERSRERRDRSHHVRSSKEHKSDRKDKSDRSDRSERSERSSRKHRSSRSRSRSWSSSSRSRRH